MNNLESLERRVAELKARNMPLTFESFRQFWQDCDELSQSLILNEICCPGLSNMPAERREVIGGYLRKMGVELTVETATLEELLAELESDP